MRKPEPISSVRTNFKVKLTIDEKLLDELTLFDAPVRDESWNGLINAVNQSAKTVLGRDVRSLVFVDNVTAEYWKSDVTFDEDVHTWQFTGPSEAEGTETPHAMQYVATAWRNGLSTFRCKTSKNPLHPI